VLRREGRQAAWRCRLGARPSCSCKWCDQAPGLPSRWGRRRECGVARSLCQLSSWSMSPLGRSTRTRGGRRSSVAKTSIMSESSTISQISPPVVSRGVQEPSQLCRSRYGCNLLVPGSDGRIFACERKRFYRRSWRQSCAGSSINASGMEAGRIAISTYAPWHVRTRRWAVRWTPRRCDHCSKSRGLRRVQLNWSASDSGITVQRYQAAGDGALSLASRSNSVLLSATGVRQLS